MSKCPVSAICIFGSRLLSRALFGLSFCCRTPIKQAGGPPGTTQAPLDPNRAAFLFPVFTKFRSAQTPSKTAGALASCSAVGHDEDVRDYTSEHRPPLKTPALSLARQGLLFSGSRCALQGAHCRPLVGLRPPHLARIFSQRESPGLVPMSPMIHDPRAVQAGKPMTAKGKPGASASGFFCGQPKSRSHRLRWA